MRLTGANTAIVLDSTADLPDAADRFPNWRVVPLYVRFGDESLRDGVDIDPTEFYEAASDGGKAAVAQPEEQGAARVERLPDDVPADAGRLPRVLRRARRL